MKAPPVGSAEAGSGVLGDSLRRRGTAPERGRPAPARPQRRRGRLTLRRWLLAALVILVGSFVTGYLLSTLVLFPAPETAGAGLPVPDLYGLAREEAASSLTDAGLELGRVEALASMDVPAGGVVAQSPVAGQQLRSGAAVDLTVSAGPPEVRIPQLKGLGIATARDLLEAAGFEVGVQQVPSAAPEGTISRTDPASGTSVRLPARVTVYVSLGPPQLDPAPASGLPGGPG